MRYVPGLDLKTLIGREGPLPPERTISILGQAASALDAAHAEGLIHRDVKPGNILITPRTESGGTDRVFLSDFGLTKRALSDSGVTATGQFVGTLDYAAPEQFEGKPLDARTDVYSLGCVLFECLTGQIPFRRDNQAALVYAHLMAEPPKITEAKPEHPEAIATVVATGMAKKPEDRHASAGALVADARAAFGGDGRVGVGAPVTKKAPPRGHEPGDTPDGPQRRWPRPVVVGVGAVAVVAVVVAAVLLSTRGGGAPGPSSGASASAAALSGKDRVVRINPATRKVVASITTGRGPSAVALGEGSVWVANSGDGTVSRIDPVGNRVTGRIHVGKRPAAIAFGDGAIWVANYLSNSVSRIDPATNKVVTTIPLDGNPSSIAAGHGAVFVASPREVSVTPGVTTTGTIVWLVDPDTNTVTATSRLVGGCPRVVAEGEEGVWVGTGQLVARVEPSTGMISSEFNPGIFAGITVGDGSVWVARLGLPARVLRLDAARKAVVQEIPVGNTGIRPDEPACIIIPLTVGNGSLWVANLDDGSISQIATVSNDVVDAFAVGKGLTGLALGQGGLWVTVDAP
jgi:YVTN family beta-propeller protein